MTYKAVKIFDKQASQAEYDDIDAINRMLTDTERRNTAVNLLALTGW